MPANHPLWGLLSRRKGHVGTATELYGRLVAEARERTFYADLGVPDTPEGRLEAVMLHVVLMLRRLAREDAATTGALAQALTETFVIDMDDCLREMGVGDMAVARKVKKAAAALFDRSRDYGGALATGDAATLAALIGRHVHEVAEGAAAPAGAVAIAAHALAAEAALTTAPLGSILDGSFRWPAPII